MGEDAEDSLGHGGGRGPRRHPRVSQTPKAGHGKLGQKTDRKATRAKN